MQTRYYMKDEVPFQGYPTYTEKSTNKSKALSILLIVVILFVVIFVGLYFLGKSKKSKAPIPNPTPTMQPTSTPSVSGSLTPTGKLTPTPNVSKLDRSKLNVSVLNGSGVVGAGKKIADYLSGLGYVINGTGNADNYNYQGISVKVKQTKSDYAALLKKDLGSVASGSAVTTGVDDTISTDAQVIVGK